jgi:hypothetical protein
MVFVFIHRGCQQHGSEISALWLRENATRKDDRGVCSQFHIYKLGAGDYTVGGAGAKGELNS